ncbi:MAG: MFS transporter [Mucilaginibacter sp.]
MKRVLPVIVISQFFCTSLWFAGNAVIGDMGKQLNLEPTFGVYLASAVQFGFITGTFLFALTSIADRFSPSLVFFSCAILAAAANLAMVVTGLGGVQLLFFRLLTGFFLAGIYPVGMKIASDHYLQGLGRSLGFLVGALVLGTALPHLLKSFHTAMPWKFVVFSTSGLAVVGGLLIYRFVPDGPDRQVGHKLNWAGFLHGFRKPEFRSSAFGYFGHMWELYAFWVFVPVMLKAYNTHFEQANLNVPVWSFLIIGSGCLACVMSGLFSQRFGLKRVASSALLTSGLCCLVSPLVLFCNQAVLFIAFLLVWGMAVVADSPLFSALVAQNAPIGSKGTSLTIVNCIGFTITIVSIQLIGQLRTEANAQNIYMILSIGPVLGLVSLWRKPSGSGKLTSNHKVND